MSRKLSDCESQEDAVLFAVLTSNNNVSTEARLQAELFSVKQEIESLRKLAIEKSVRVVELEGHVRDLNHDMVEMEKAIEAVHEEYYQRFGELTT